MIDLGFLHLSQFYQLAALLMLASIVGFLGVLFRQPMIVSFIAVGVLSGSSVLGVVGSYQNIDLLAELGVTVLLFLVGLKLDLKLIKTLGRVALATGLGQVFFTSGIGFFIGMALNFNVITSIYIAVALTFSSTIIIVKLLSDKKEVDSLHGRIAIGFLIVQDLVVVLSMMVLSTFGIGSQVAGDANVALQIGSVFLYTCLMLIGVAFFIRFLATPLVRRIAYSPELLITFAIGWAALFASLGSHLGLSKELGGLLAGVSLASTPFREAIVARLSSLRDFLLLFFFIALGSKIDIHLLGAQFFPALIFSLFVLIGNPLIVMMIMGYMGYRKRTGFLAGLTVAQISEFSLIFVAMGMTLGHVKAEALGLVTLVGLITIALSVYMITYSHVLYRWFEPYIGIFERKVKSRLLDENDTSLEGEKYEVILFGLGRYGSAIAECLRKSNFKILVVDFNPDELRRSRAAGYKVVYGDASDQDFIGSLPLESVQWVISAMPQHDLGLTHEDPRLILIDALKREGYAGKIAVSTQQVHEEKALMEKGANLVFLPFHDAAARAVERMRELNF